MGRWEWWVASVGVSVGVNEARLRQLVVDLLEHRAVVGPALLQPLQGFRRLVGLVLRRGDRALVPLVLPTRLLQLEERGIRSYREAQNHLKGGEG